MNTTRIPGFRELMHTLRFQVRVQDPCEVELDLTPLRPWVTPGLIAHINLVFCTQGKRLFGQPITYVALARAEDIAREALIERYMLGSFGLRGGKWDIL